MKFTIIIHSQTGHSMTVAKRLEEVLLNKGHEVRLKRIKEEDEKLSQNGMVVLKEIPELGDCDYVIFGGPVWRFSLSFVISKYFEQLPSLGGKKVGCFVTQYFPFSWMGGKRSLKMLKDLCLNKAGVVYASGIINWCRRSKDKQIEALINTLSTI